MCADPAGLPSLLHLLYNMARLRGQHSCPQMTQMNTDKSRSCIDREFSTLHSSAKLNHHAGSFFLTCFFICVHLRHLRTDPPIPSFAIKLIPRLDPLATRRADRLAPPWPGCVACGCSFDSAPRRCGRQ